MSATEGNPISIRIPGDVLASLDEVGRALDRSRSWLVVHAVRRFLSEEAEGVMAAAKGAAEIDRGESEDMDEVLKDLDAIIDAAERKRGRLALLRRGHGEHEVRIRPPEAKLPREPRGAPGRHRASSRPAG